MRYGIIWPVFRLRLLQLGLFLVGIGMIWVITQLPFISDFTLGLILIFPVAVTGAVVLTMIVLINDHLKKGI